MRRTRPGRISAAAALAVVVAFAAGGAGGFFAHPILAPCPSPDPPVPPSDRTTVTALGRLQPAGGVIPVYGPPGDRVTEMEAGIAPGRWLEKNDPIAKLESRVTRRQELTVAEVQEAEAKESLVKARHAGEQRILAAEAELAKIDADEKHDTALLDIQIETLAEHLRLAQLQVGRLRDLAAKIKVAGEDRDQADLAKVKAEGELKAAKANREKAVAGYTAARAAAKAKLVAARAELDEATARVPLRSAGEKVKLVKQLYDLTELKAPVEGSVLKVVSHVGDPTGSHQPILHMADTRAMVVVAEVYESEVQTLRRLLAGGRPVRVRVTSPALPAEGLAGELTGEGQIARMIARNVVFSPNPREDADRRVVDISVPLDRASAGLAAGLVGLQVQVRFEGPAAGDGG